VVARPGVVQPYLSENNQGIIHLAQSRFHLFNSTAGDKQPLPPDNLLCNSNVAGNHLFQNGQPVRIRMRPSKQYGALARPFGREGYVVATSFHHSAKVHETRRNSKRKKTRPRSFRATPFFYEHYPKRKCAIIQRKCFRKLFNKVIFLNT
jgi:hypothetical protein